MSILALAQRALCAVFDPGGAAEPCDPVFVLAGLGDVIADGVCLARVRDAAWAAFALGHQREVTVGRWAGQRPAVHFPLQTLAALAVVDPGVTAGVDQQAVLMKTLRCESRVTLRTAEQVQRGVVTIAHHPSAHDPTRLARADGASVIVQHPDLSIVLDLVVMDTVTGAVVTVGTAAVVSAVKVKTRGVVGARAASRAALVDVFTRLSVGGENLVVMVTITAFAVIPAR